MTYDSEVLEELCSEFNLAEYVASEYDARWSGGKLWLHCPLHEDDTPSMSIDPKWNNFYCFSCKSRGSPIDWFRRVEGLTFQQSVEYVSKAVGKHILSFHGILLNPFY